MRVLLLADTHLGFDSPRAPRLDLPRRGPDFWACQQAALEPAFAGRVDLVVHGGDLLFRSKVPPGLVEQALAPYLELARAGTPVLIVPGNHERGWIPRSLFCRHPLLHICNTPRTVLFAGPWGRAAFSGIPWRRDIRDGLPELLDQAGWGRQAADFRVLCLHQAVEGAVVGPAEFMFRRGPDVVSLASLPRNAQAVLSGHIHRGQVLGHDLAGRPLPCPVIYPGSVERTSFAEAGETKHCLLLEFGADAPGPCITRLPLPARPMAAREIRLAGLDPVGLGRVLDEACSGLPADGVLGLLLRGHASPELEPLLRASVLRERLPKGLRLSVNRRILSERESPDA